MYMWVLSELFHLSPDPGLPTMKKSPEQHPRVHPCPLFISDPETINRQLEQCSQHSATGTCSSRPGDEQHGLGEVTKDGTRIKKKNAENPKISNKTGELKKSRILETRGEKPSPHSKTVP